MQAFTIIALVSWQITDKICVNSLSIITGRHSNKQSLL